jgi:hypothetical protein
MSTPDSRTTHRAAICLVALAALAIPSSAWAASPGAADANSESRPKKEKVRVYTNADLDALEPIPTQAKPIARSTLPGQHDMTEDADWNTIMAFIDRERAYEQNRQDQSQSYALAREQQKRQDELLDQMSENNYNGGYYGGYPIYGGGGCSGYGCNGGGFQLRPRPSPYYFQPLPLFPLGPPTTLTPGPYPRSGSVRPHPAPRGR